MTKALALLILAAVLVGLAVLACIENRPNGLAAPLLMDAAALDCPKLANPCDRIDCNRSNPKEIA